MKHVCKQVGERTDIYNIKQLSTICIAMAVSMFVFIGLYAMPPWIRYIVILTMVVLTIIYIGRNKTMISMILKKS